MYFDIRQRTFELAYFYKKKQKVQDLDDQTFLLQLVINGISILLSIVGHDIFPKQKFHRPYYFSSKSLTYVHLRTAFLRRFIERKRKDETLANIKKITKIKYLCSIYTYLNYLKPCCRRSFHSERLVV